MMPVYAEPLTDRHRHVVDTSDIRGEPIGWPRRTTYFRCRRRSTAADLTASVMAASATTTRQSTTLGYQPLARYAASCRHLTPSKSR
jgi:hypothetical protein